jgi:hypothetical protein
MSAKHWNDMARLAAHGMFAHCNGSREHDGGHVSQCDEMTLVIAAKLQSMTYRDDVHRELMDVRGLLSDLMTMIYDQGAMTMFNKAPYTRAFTYLETLKVPEDK